MFFSPVPSQVRPGPHHNNPHPIITCQSYFTSSFHFIVTIIKLKLWPLSVFKLGIYSYIFKISKLQKLCSPERRKEVPKCNLKTRIVVKSSFDEGRTLDMRESTCHQQIPFRGNRHCARLWRREIARGGLLGEGKE